MERRNFLKMSAALGAAATVSGCDSSSKDANVVPPKPPVTDEQLNWSACLVNCGSNCPVKVFSRDGSSPALNQIMKPLMNTASTIRSVAVHVAVHCVNAPMQQIDCANP